jgi:trehalose 6-phosphate phosphatase
MTIFSILSTTGQQRLSNIVHKNMLCCFDFDGTLVPIIDDPEKSQLTPDITQKLLQLMNYVKVAVISGRSVAMIKPRLGFTPHFIVGNHGIEGLPGWENKAQQHAQLCTQWNNKITAALQNHAVFNSNIWLENKTFSLAVHYRSLQDKKPLTQLFTQLTPAPRILEGKSVYNLLPEGAQNKGDALKQLITITHARNTLYIGDDLTDEDVFCLNRHDLLSIKIGKDPKSQADFFLPHQLDIGNFIDDLIKRLKK